MSQTVNTQLITADPASEPKENRNASRLIQLLLIPLLLFFANWIPRVAGLDVFVTADEYDWMQRTMNLTSALARRSWAETFQYEHPAVTTLWLGVLGVLQQAPGFIQKAVIDPEPYKRPLEFWTMAELGVTPLQLLVAGRWWVVLAIAITTTIAYFPLRRLAGTAVAVVGLLFIAWSPVAVGFSRQLQPDGLVASTSFASLAFFLGWLYGGRRTRDLVISGILMGLGWLTKTPAGFLVPGGRGPDRHRAGPPVRRRGQRGRRGGAAWCVAPTGVGLRRLGYRRLGDLFRPVARHVGGPGGYVREDVRANGGVFGRPHKPELFLRPGTLRPGADLLSGGLPVSDHARGTGGVGRQQWRPGGAIRL